MCKKSPFEAVYTKLGANFSMYDGWRMASTFGDLSAEQAALTEHCAAFDLSNFGRFQVKGCDFQAFIGDTCVEGTEPIDANTWAWRTLKGIDSQQIVCRIGHFDGDYILLTEPRQSLAFEQLISAYTNSKPNSDIKCTIVTEKTAMLGLYGPKAYEVLSSILPFDLSDMNENSVKKTSFFMMSLMVIRGSWLNTDGMELICPASAGGLAASAIVKYKDQKMITPAGMETLVKAMSEKV